jgi:hypothetical protein
MALQSSGAISISQIKTELGSASNSLRTLSSQAGKSTPDAMSEFYGYASEYMTAQQATVQDAYISGYDYVCGCIETLTVYQTSAGRWLRGPNIGDTPLSGLYNYDGGINSFSNGIAGGTIAYCGAFC